MSKMLEKDSLANVEAPKKEKKKANKKPNIFVRFGRKMKDVFSELKKVSWPGFSKVVKQTGVVIVVVLAFLVVISAFDFALYELLRLLVVKQG